MIDLQDVKVKNSSDWDSICPFPVGFIYMSRNKNSPADLYGGQWSEMPTGRFIQIVNTSSGNIVNGGATAHIHITTIGKAAGETTLYIVDGDRNYPGEWTDPTGAPYNAILTGGSKVFSSGGSGVYYSTTAIPSHNTLNNNSAFRLSPTGQSNHTPPYTTAYAWYRTA